MICGCRHWLSVFNNLLICFGHIDEAGVNTHILLACAYTNHFECFLTYQVSNDLSNGAVLILEKTLTYFRFKRWDNRPVSYISIGY